MSDSITPAGSEDDQRNPVPVEADHFNRLEFYKENYYKEVERLSRLTNEIALQGTVMIALISGIFYLLNLFATAIPRILAIFQFVTFVELVLIIVTGYYLFSSYYKFAKKGRAYQYLPELKKIDKYYDDCKGISDQPRFDKYLKDNFIEMSDKLFRNNNDKTRSLTEASKWMTFSFTGAAVIVLIFFLNFIGNPYYIENQKNKSKHERSARAAKATGTSTGATTRTDSTRTNHPDRKKRELGRTSDLDKPNTSNHQGEVKRTK
jgi:hypothetical protein